MNGGRYARRSGLQGLRPPDLAAVGGDGRVVRHVLRFERNDAQTPVGHQAAQPSDDQRFADVRSGPHEH